MMRLSVAVVLTTTAACAGGTPQDRSTAVPQLAVGLQHAGCPYVYRYEGRIRETVEDRAATRRVSGRMFVECAGRRLQIREAGDDARFVPIADDAAVRLYFPSVIGSEDNDARRRTSWIAERIDEDYVGAVVPFDEVLNLRTDGSNVLIDFVREGSITDDGSDPWTASVRQTGRAVYDPVQAHYESVDMRFRLEVREPSAPEPVETRTGRLSITYDASQTAARRHRRRQIASAEATGADSLDGYLETNSLHRELEMVAEELTTTAMDRHVSALQWFHAHANPVPMWRLAVAYPQDWSGSTSCGCSALGRPSSEHS